MNQELLEYKLKGYCCSQIITHWGLKQMGKENPDMVQASAGLCFGMNQGKNCGILSAGMCILHLADPEAADLENCRDFYDWFEETFGSIECDDLLEGNPLNKVEKCPMMIEASMTKLAELLEWDY